MRKRAAASVSIEETIESPARNMEMIKDLFSRLSEVIMDTIPADASLLAVFNREGETILEKTRGFGGDGSRKILISMVKDAAGTGRPLVADDFCRPGAVRDSAGITWPYPCRVLCFPWKTKGRPGGVAFFVRGPGGRPFLPDELELVSLILMPAILRMEREAVAGTGEEGSGPFNGESEAISKINSMILRLGRCDAPVLILGESGTGKELAARALHRSGRRRDGPFVAVNCAAIPETLLESELFGYARGAFTGAFRDKAGLIEEAAGGAFFLDEIGDLSLALQVKLLRVLEERKIRRVGETKTRPVDVRFISATNKDLEAEVGHGNFRQDLYYRLKIVSLELPPLRFRKTDIYVLADLFIDEFSRSMDLPRRFLTPAAMELIAAYDWPGNVRELQNEIQRCLVLAGESLIIGEELLSARINPAGLRRLPAFPLFRQARADFERSFLRQTLTRCGWNRTRAAGEMGLSRQGLFKLLKKHGIEREVEMSA